MDIKYYKIDLNFLLQEEVIAYDIYIKINTRYIRYMTKEFVTFDEILKLQQKGFDCVYLTAMDYAVYIGRKEVEVKKQMDQSSVVMENASLFIKNNELLKKLFNTVGKNEFKAQVILDTVAYAKQIWEHSDELSSLIELFKDISDETMVKKQMDLFLLFSMESALNFNKTKVDQIASAIICMDLKLSNNDYWNCYDSNKLNNVLMNHSLKVLDYLPTNFFHADIISFIKTHHEAIDGQGFPLAFKSAQLSNINVLYNIIDEFNYVFLYNKTKINSIQNTFDKIEKKYMRFATNNDREMIKKLLLSLKSTVLGVENV